MAKVRENLKHKKKNIFEKIDNRGFLFYLSIVV